MSMNPELANWRMEEIDDTVVLTLDVAGQSSNTLSSAVLEEFDRVLGQIEGRPLKGIVIRSAKTRSFIVGADVTQFRTISDAMQATGLARTAQGVFSRLARLPFPSIALIHGNCLGGGLELALACTYRIAREDEGTRLGLPEVRLGIHPGFAGTVRLPRLVGDLAALDLMLTGRSVSARQALALGLVDEIVPDRHLLDAAYAFAARHPRPKRAPWWKHVPSWSVLRKPVVRLLQRPLRKKVDPEHYPAPYRILDLWRRAAAQDAEALSLGEMMVSRTSRSLVDIFLIGEELKRRGRRQPHGVTHVHVIGAGTMGADIAIWAAFKGFRVSLQDQNQEALARAIGKAHGFYRKKLRKRAAIQDAMDRLMPDTNGNGLRRADLVIEAIIENADAKRDLLKSVEGIVRPDTLLATNTSSIPLEILGEALKDPSRLVGLHFFNPVAQMQLVEIVRGRQTGEEALDRARAFTVAIDRLPLDVQSSPGFLVNRVLMPYLIEAMVMVEEGVAIEQIDLAATRFGMPMGPVLLADTVGLDICLSVAEMLAVPLGIQVPERLRETVARGNLGKKSGRGFYVFDKSGRPKRKAVRRHSDVPVTERMILRMLNGAVACLREGVVSDRDAVDAGMVYGTGFAPYLGGPMRYAEALGEVGIASSLKRLAHEYGSRFDPDEGWSRPELLSHRMLPQD
ncbi:MAG: 3-hydroxyacyl-CoA dehydrogenase NAD-binding domain-containing protein [Pseudomonadota bacterium]|nr:3-hydroxyacyl-CoA dehydrogenase NAD-binding domain-containing protein [Pseudomonadota bacterium]